MDVPQIVFPSEDRVCICGAIKQDWEGVGKEAIDRNPASNSHFWRACCEPGTVLRPEGPLLEKGQKLFSHIHPEPAPPHCLPGSLIPEMKDFFLEL